MTMLYQTVKKDMRRRGDWIKPLPPKKVKAQALVMKIVGKHLAAMISGKTDHSAPKVAKLQVQDPLAIIKQKEKERQENLERER
jgi:hypothetical protein